MVGVPQPEGVAQSTQPLLMAIGRLTVVATPVVTIVRGRVVRVVGGDVDWRSVVARVLVGGRFVTSWVVLVGVMLVTPGESIFFFGRRSLRQVGAPQEASCVPGIYGTQKLVFSIGSRETNTGLRFLAAFGSPPIKFLKPCTAWARVLLLFFLFLGTATADLKACQLGFGVCWGPKVGLADVSP